MKDPWLSKASKWCDANVWPFRNLRDILAATQAGAVKRHLEKIESKTLRLKPRQDFVGNRSPQQKQDKSIIGSYHMEFEGANWTDEVYQPGKMWLDTKQSQYTDGVYEGSSTSDPP